MKKLFTYFLVTAIFCSSFFYNNASNFTESFSINGRINEKIQLNIYLENLDSDQIINLKDLCSEFKSEMKSLIKTNKKINTLIKTIRGITKNLTDSYNSNYNVDFFKDAEKTNEYLKFSVKKLNKQQIDSFKKIAAELQTNINCIIRPQLHCPFTKNIYKSKNNILQNELFNYLNNLLINFDTLTSLITKQEIHNITKQILEIKDKIFTPNFSNPETRKLGIKLLHGLIESLSFGATKYEDLLLGKYVPVYSEESFEDKLWKIIGIENTRKLKQFYNNLNDKMCDEKFIKSHSIEIAQIIIDIIPPEAQNQDIELNNLINEIKEKLIHLFKEHMINKETPFDDKGWNIFSKISLFIRDNLLPLSDDKLLMFFNQNNQSEMAEKLRLKLLNKFNEMLNDFALQPIKGE